MSPRFGVVVAARSGSRRLPGKALMPLAGVPSVVYLLNRLRDSRQADELVFATTTLAEDDRLADTVAGAGYKVFRGAGEDVVGRFVAAAAAYGMDYVGRVTGDCPFVGSEDLDFCLEQCRKMVPFDLASTKTVYPVGIDYEIYSAPLMAQLDRSGVLTDEDREHLTKHIYDHAAAKGYRVVRLAKPDGWPDSRLSFTLDTPDDYRFITDVADKLSSPLAPVTEILAVANTLG